jgi:hypothetical protein
MSPEEFRRTVIAARSKPGWLLKRLRDEVKARHLEVESTALGAWGYTRPFHKDYTLAEVRVLIANYVLEARFGTEIGWIEIEPLILVTYSPDFMYEVHRHEQPEQVQIPNGGLAENVVPLWQECQALGLGEQFFPKEGLRLQRMFLQACALRQGWFGRFIASPVTAGRNWLRRKSKHA